MDRRTLLKSLSAAPLLQFTVPALAQTDWPQRNITIIVPFPAGGQADLAARPIGIALERLLGKPVVVDNRAGGAGGSIGNAQAARAEPDGYTLLMTLSSLAVLPEAAVHLVTPPGGPRPARVEVLAEFLAKRFARGRRGK